MSKYKVVYGPKMVSDSHNVSPSAVKPKLFVDSLRNSEYVEFFDVVEPEAVLLQDLFRCHDENFVRDVLELRRPNGFGTKSQSVADSLPFTNGAMYTGAKLALGEDKPVCVAVSGFHHAGYAGFEHLGYFCTFNGLMVTATRLKEEGKIKRVVIVDCDMHDGNGTEEIRRKIDPLSDWCMNLSFGRRFSNPSHASKYLNAFSNVKHIVEEWKPEVILYQSGADVHINDPFGGVLTEDQMYERDIKMFTISKESRTPIVWNLAGGYQKDLDGSCNYVLRLHLNTIKACLNVYGKD